MILDFIVLGKPVAKARPRVTRTGHTYTPQATKDYEDLVAGNCKDAMDRKLPFEKACGVAIEFWLPLPKDKLGKYKKGERFMPVARPDIDNYAKSILDGMNGIAYLDDSQIVKLEVEKMYTVEEPYTRVTVYPTILKGAA